MARSDWTRANNILEKPPHNQINISPRLWVFGGMAEVSDSERFLLERFLKRKKSLYFIKLKTPFSTVANFSEASFRGCRHKIQYYNPDVRFGVSS